MCGSNRAASSPVVWVVVVVAHNFISIVTGHLGDLFAKPGVSGYSVTTNPHSVGFDDWMLTEAEASSSMSNCGCFPINHTTPGPKPPSGYPKISPHGDHCVVGGGFESDWCCEYVGRCVCVE